MYVCGQWESLLGGAFNEGKCAFLVILITKGAGVGVNISHRYWDMSLSVCERQKAVRRRARSPTFCPWTTNSSMVMAFTVPSTASRVRQIAHSLG